MTTDVVYFYSYPEKTEFLTLIYHNFLESKTVTITTHITNENKDALIVPEEFMSEEGNIDVLSPGETKVYAFYRILF